MECTLCLHCSSPCRLKQSCAYPKVDPSVGTSANEFALLRRLASRAGVPDRQREPARREPMAEPAAGVRVELCCRRGRLSGGAALIPMVESAEDRQAHDLHSTFGSVDFPAIRCVLAEREMGA